MSTASGSLQLSCTHCGASNAWDASVCWVCHAPLAHQPVLAVGAEKTPTLAARQPAPAHLTTILLCIAAVATLIGLWHEAPGIAVLVAVVFTPALLVTATASGLRKHQGKPMTTGEKATRFILSVAMTISLLVILGIVAVVAFIVWLFAVCTQGGFH
jgi:hypothetical protein